MLRTLLAVCCLLPTVGAMDHLMLHVSGYGPQIQAFHLTPAGELVPLSSSAGGENPSFIALHPLGPWAYALNETGEGKIRGFSRDPLTGALTERTVVPSGGKGPCHLSVTPDGRWLLVAHYGSGHVSLLPINADGDVGAAADVQQAGRNAHMAITDPAGKVVYVPCLGSNHIALYRIDSEAGRLVPLDPPTIATAAGAGPRHLTFRADGRHAYVINELNNTITAYTVQDSGALVAGASVSTLPEGFAERSKTAHIVLSPDGRTVWGSNRGHDSLARFRVAEDGSLTISGHDAVGDGLKTPRHFAISPDGRFLIAAAQNADLLLRYAVEADGSLRLLGSTPCPGKPCSVVFGG